jgi:hypothetical protein
MFPGDTNNDGIANYYDILPIGLAYNSAGPPREIPNIDWMPQEFFQWGQILPFSGVEYGFIDCDGNGIIDSLDVEAIAFNYDQMQLEANPPPMPYELPDTLFTTNIPELSISFNVDTVMVMDTFFAEIIINYPGPGDIEPALGIAFGLEYDAELVKDSLTVIFPDTIADDLMFISAASNFLSFYRLPQEGRIEMGAAGRGQNAINGPRVLAKVRFVVEDVIIRSVEREFAFTFTDILLINVNEQVLEIGTFSDTIILIDTSSVLVEEVVLHDEIQVYPNPASDYITIESGDFNLKDVLIYNRLGQVVFSRKITNQNRIHIKIENLPHGIYFAKIHTDKGILTKKICFF